jgi:hypothetical protein
LGGRRREPRGGGGCAGCGRGVAPLVIIKSGRSRGGEVIICGVYCAG